MIEKLDFSKLKYSHIKPLDIEIVLKGRDGDRESIIKIIEHFKPYLKELATELIVDKYGNKIYYLDETLRTQLENKLIKSVLKFEVRLY